MTNPHPSLPGRMPDSTTSGDRLLLLETLVRIVEAGSLSAAAAQLGTTQPTISRRLQALERQLGTPLLQRTTHAMKLTDQGQLCYAHAKRLQQDWLAFENDMRGDQGEPSGVLRVLAPHAFGQHQFIQPLVQYLQRYPLVQVEWLLHDRTPDFLAENMDCAIQVGNVTEPSVIAVKIGEIPRIVIGAPSLFGEHVLPQHASELAGLPWLALRTFYRHQVSLTHRQTGEVVRFEIQPRLSTDGLYALRNAAAFGLGVGIASAWALDAEIDSGRLLHLTPQWQADPLPVHLVYPPARYYPARLSRFIEIMRTALPAIVRSATLPQPD